MRDAFIAIDAGTDLKAHARALQRTWDATLRGGPVRLHARPIIEQSWSRLTSLGSDPGRLRPRRAVEADELGELRSASPLSIVLPVLRNSLGAFAHDAEHVVVICDATGTILWLEGHTNVLTLAGGITFTEGMSWTEESAGTNAIGTALAIDHAVQVFSAEHYLAEQHAWWCSAAPIHDPATGSLLGVVDLSGPMATAHPHSLALVMAAAARAEDMLRMQRTAADDRLRDAYLHRSAGGAAHRTALIAEDGRVLLAHPAGWLAGRVEAPSEAGVPVLAGGLAFEAEPLGRGGAWVLREHAGGARSPALSRRPRLRLELQGRHPLTAALDDGGEPLELSLRHAEILALLVLHPAGLTAEQLTLHLYGEAGNPISTRAEMSRLRKLLAAALAARPYRLLGKVTADFLDVERHLEAGAVGAALSAYRGPLLAESESERIRQAADELEGALRRAAMAGTPSELWAWLQADSGRDDPLAMEAYLRRAGSEDPRRSLVAARLHGLRVRWQAEAEAAAPAAAVV